ncbi:polyprenyl synthetase family protein [Loktanella sp. D2R18]|uniref:polyprenyl synthetase family protein n=1 Tax=Rhodobacterales TaxID=204455 RepID=UPI000DE98088|nr:MULTISPECIES: polyprenyl synthetase family protein [Rhodobacterales]MDO6591376.1 polyprenyl synthetase family protein [Yoonia sp. 1_MG-2023]RBW43553.1 polyprenyl synthetase family protein [Loktanella sp. D2R18]
MADTFRSALGEAAALTQSYIAAVLAGQPGAIAQGMTYATQGGKALRAFLVLESAKLHGVTTALPAAAAIECMHAYSLVHDDLPCMDDDNLRRGLPTVHVKWDEATAVLVGDALQAMAFECVLQVDAAADARILLAQTLAQASGVRGMVGGQAADIAAETAHIPLSLDEITALQAGKTGALINWSAMSGARLAQADACALQRYGDALGLAFQIWDDVLDVIGDADQVGKAVGKDADAGKATFVSLLGLDGAKRRASDLVQEACDALSVYGDDADTLKEAARFVIARTH